MVEKKQYAPVEASLQVPAGKGTCLRRGCDIDMAMVTVIRRCRQADVLGVNG